MKNTNKIIGELKGEKITRKDAIKKAGATALTVTTLIFLETKSASADSTYVVPPDTENSAQRLGGQSDGTARPDR